MPAVQATAFDRKILNYRQAVSILVVCFSTYSQKVNLNRCISSNFRLETLALVRCEANEVKIEALLPDQKGCHPLG